MIEKCGYCGNPVSIMDDDVVCLIDSDHDYPLDMEPFLHVHKRYNSDCELIQAINEIGTDNA